MENNYATIQNPRRAKLVELVGENSEPKYLFKGSSIDFRNCPKEAGSDLTYLTFKDTEDFKLKRKAPLRFSVDKEEIKNIAMKTFEEFYNRKLFIENQTLFNSYQNNSMDDWYEMKANAEEKLENLKFKNFYNPFSKKFWNQGEGPSKNLLDLIKFGSLGIGIYDLIAKNPKISAGNWLGVGIFTGIISEAIRIGNKMGNKRELKSINQNIEFYDNFRRNIEKADVSIIAPEEAKQIYKDLKNSQGAGRFVKVDFDSANQELINVYQKY